MARHIILATVLLTACADAPEEGADPTQATVLVDFEAGFPPAGVDFTDHTTDGGVWQSAEVSAHGEGTASAQLTASADPMQAEEAGFAVLGMHPVELVAPAVFSMDLAFAMRPFNSPQRLEVRLTGSDADEQVDFELDNLAEVWLGDGTERYEPATDEWFAVEVPLDPATLGDEVQITLVVTEDFAGLRPDLFVDNLAVRGE